MFSLYYLGPERKNAVIEEKNRILVAYHESGHAVVAIYTPGILRLFSSIFSVVCIIC